MICDQKKICECCGGRMRTTGNYQKFCVKCRPLRRLKLALTHRIKNRERDLEKKRVRRLMNLDEERKRGREYYAKNRDRIRERERVAYHLYKHRGIHAEYRKKQRELIAFAKAIISQTGVKP